MSTGSDLADAGSVSCSSSASFYGALREQVRSIDSQLIVENRILNFQQIAKCASVVCYIILANLRKLEATKPRYGVLWLYLGYPCATPTSILRSFSDSASLQPRYDTAPFGCGETFQHVQ